MIRFASWNIEGRLSLFKKKGRGSPQHILSTIAHLDADVVFLLEAFGTHPPLGKSVNESLKKLGYSIKDVEYEDIPGERVDMPIYPLHSRLLTRIPTSSFKVNRLGELRNSIEVEFIDPASNKPIRMIGIHLDDRSEALRQRQLVDLIPIINNSTTDTIMVGDFNAMHGMTRRALFIKTWLIRGMATLLPSRDIRRIAQNVIEMANGSILSSIESETSLRDIDPHKSATVTPKRRGYEFLPSIRLLDIDHIMVSEGLITKDFEIGRFDGGADHRPLQVTVSNE
jgi:endonuclease/exonuclease/phosphatase family metal-dependent hydrolase